MTIDTTDYQQWISSPFTQMFLAKFKQQIEDLSYHISRNPPYHLPDILESYTYRGSLFAFERLVKLLNDEEYCIQSIKELYGE